MRRSLDTAALDAVLDLSRAVPGERLKRQVRIHRVTRFLVREERRLTNLATSDPRHLHNFEASVYSQNGEDGILAEIFRRIGVGHRNFVEIGASDGEENCTRRLVESGWSGVWIEGDPDRARRAMAVIGSRPVRIANTWIDRESVVDELAKLMATPETDLLSIDIDGNDYWIWRSVARHVRARVVVIEYNAKVGPWMHWTLPYDARHRWDETARHGAGLRALAALGRELGYSLVGCDRRGVNAFFVTRSDADQFTSRTIRQHWVPPRYQLPYGHEWR